MLISEGRQEIGINEECNLRAHNDVNCKMETVRDGGGAGKG